MVQKSVSSWDSSQVNEMKCLLTEFTTNRGGVEDISSTTLFQLKLAVSYSLGIPEFAKFPSTKRNPYVMQKTCYIIDRREALCHMGWMRIRIHGEEGSTGIITTILLIRPYNTRAVLLYQRCLLMYFVCLPDWKLFSNLARMDFSVFANGADG